MEDPTNKYGHMLEKYRDVDEDEILSNLTAEELQQLEGEIDREVLNKIPEETVEEDEYVYSSTSDEYSSTESEKEEEIVPATIEEQKSAAPPHTNTEINNFGGRRKSVDEKSKRLGKTPHQHQFKIPQLRKAKSREKLRRQKSEEGGELKKELMQAVRNRTKRRTSRANSSGISRRYKRQNSTQLRKRRNSKVAKEDRKDAPVNTNFITQEMLSLRPKLKKVQTREPAKVNDMLHGVSLGHITSGAKNKTENEESDANPEEEEERGEIEEDSSEGEDQEDTDPPADDAVAKANDNVHRRLNVRSMGGDCNDDTMSSTTAGSTSAESYDVVGELSINPNSVEETLLRVWEDDENLTEVNLNNIQNVDMSVFEELASAMECNTHVKHLHLANVGLTDKPARALASMLKRNKTLEKLNVESNFITGDVALRIVVALRRNHTLTELRIDNQRHIFGAKVEHEFSKILKDNKTLLRFGYQFANPGPRMSASNTLTRNMDDVRKKRVTEQRKRAQAGHTQRPQLRRQPSSEWYRKQKAEGLKNLKERGELDLQGALKDGNVQKVLSQMHPSEFAILEQWFVNRLMNNKEDETPQKKVQKKVPTPKRQPSPRDQLLSSIRQQSGLLTPKSKGNRLCPSPAAHSDAESGPPSIRVQEAPRPASPLPPVLDGESPTFKPAHHFPEVASSSNGSDDIISWKDGDEYDSDEYEVVEIEVSESDNDVSDDVTGDDVTGANAREDDEDGSSSNESSSSSSSRRKPGSKEDAIKSLDRLKIFDKYESLVYPSSADKDSSPLPRRRKKLSSSSSSPTSSSSSLSPSTPRPVRGDDSWISGRPFYKLGSR